MRKLYIPILLMVLAAFGACTDLDTPPRTQATPNNLLASPESYEQFLAKIYAGLAVSGQQGPAGNGDIEGIDEGFSQYIRGYWKAQELPTDEAVTAWGDVGIQDYHRQDWTATNQFLTALYARIFYQVALVNEFLRETTEDRLNERGISEEVQEDIQTYRAEARFLRALSYWHGLDLFRNIPFRTEETPLSAGPPEQATAQQVFDYIEAELLDIEDDLFAPRTGPYARADQAAAWVLLTKLYLNAEVYTGQDRYTDAITYASRVIQSGAYSLTPAYSHLFLTDNNTSNEIIFPVAFDSEATRSFGGMTFLTHMPVGGEMDPAEFGIDGGWFGMRTTSAIVDLFPAGLDGSIDERAGLFVTQGQTRTIENLANFTDGIGVVKYRNVSSTGAPGANGLFPDTDFPMFRLADVYLMYAEAVVRGGTGGSRATAVDYINEIRRRAYNNDNGNITDSQLTLDFLLDERARELYWECHRRTDLVRFGVFTDRANADVNSDKAIWPWKGGVAGGRETEPFRRVYPIPNQEINLNDNLTQNDGYN